MKLFLRILCSLMAGGLLGAVLFCITLMLCPGMSIFGVRYIGFLQEQQISTELLKGNLSGNVVIEANELNVEVCFSATEAGVVTYKQSFMGFTTSKMGETFFSCEEKNGVNTISFNDPKSIIFGVNRMYNGIKIVLPQTLESVSVNCEKSDVTFTGKRVVAQAVSVNSLGTVNFDTAIHAQNVSVQNAKVNFNNAISNNAVVTINTKKSINVAVDNNANFNIITNNSTVKMASCGELNVTSKNGALKMRKGAEVFGDANISTNGGNIVLGKIYGTANVSSLFANVSMEYAKTAKISNSKGSTKVENAEIVNIVSESGAVEVLKCSTHTKVQTTTGSVTLGDTKQENKTGFVNNVSVSTKKGKIKAFGVIGERCTLDSKWGAIIVQDCNVGRLKIGAENGKVNANNIISENTQIVSNSTINVGFLDIVGDVKIYGGRRAVNVSVPEDKDFKCDISTGQKPCEIQIKDVVVSSVSFSNQTENSTYSLKIVTNQGRVKVA